MAPSGTTSTSKGDDNPLIPDIEAATARLRASNKRLAQASRKVSSAYLDGIEKYLLGLAEIERKVAAQTQLEPVAQLIDAHAALTESLTKASISGVRQLILA